MEIAEKFKAIVIDPPWNERGGGKIVRGAQKHYKLMEPSQIIQTVMQCDHWKNVAENAHLYLWVTNNHLPDGLSVMDALGFRYITNICWSKNRIGLGQYFRGKHELCLFGTRGRGIVVRTSDRSISSLIEAPKTGHSRKPNAFYDMVARRSEGPYLDMFSRQVRSGWTVWGDEVSQDKE